jgi:hydroxypyruvate isomerase
MPRFAANLSMLFTEYPFIERFDRAATAGFEAVEFLFPYDEEIPAIRAALQRNGLTQVLFNLPAGDFAKGDRGMANDPRRVDEFKEGVARALDIATTLGCKKLNCLVGVALGDIPHHDQKETLYSNLGYATEQAETAGVLQLIEPLNHFDAPNFFLPTILRAHEVLWKMGEPPNLLIQFDVYHQQRMLGNITKTFERYFDQIGHIQIADSPNRNQPGSGEINFPYVFDAIDKSGYDGWVSLEYKPLGTTEESLSWLRKWGYWPDELLEEGGDD